LEPYIFEFDRMSETNEIVMVSELGNNLFPLVIGSFFIVGGILGKRFTTGLATKTPVPAWYGRPWIIGFGMFLLAGAIAHRPWGHTGPGVRSHTGPGVRS
jgi:hypothetical protein